MRKPEPYRVYRNPSIPDFHIVVPVPLGLQASGIARTEGVS